MNSTGNLQNSSNFDHETFSAPLLFNSLQQVILFYSLFSILLEDKKV